MARQKGYLLFGLPCFADHEGKEAPKCKEKAMLCSFPRNADCSMQGAVHDIAAVLTVNRLGDMWSVQIPSSKYGTRVSRDYVQYVQLL